MTISKAKREARRVAPYVTIGALSSFFDHIRRVSAPETVTSKILADYGISESHTFALLSALKFFGLTEADGKPTPDFKLLQTSGDEFKEHLREIVTRSYQDLFARLDPSVDDREHIRNFFIRNYSAATAEKATALFLDLCGEAGIPVKEENRRRKVGVKKQVGERKVKGGEQKQPPFAGTEGETRREGQPRFDIRIDSKDFVSMQPEQIQSFFNGLSKIIKPEEK